MSELGSATVQVWARKKAERMVRIEAEADRMFRRLDTQINLLAPPKPWLADAIRKWWRGKGD